MAMDLTTISDEKSVCVTMFSFLYYNMSEAITADSRDPQIGAD